VSPNIGPVGIGVGIRSNYPNVFSHHFEPLVLKKAALPYSVRLRASTRTYARVAHSHLEHRQHPLPLSFVAHEQQFVI